MLTMFISATTPFSHTLCLFTFQIFCTSVDSITVSWLPILLIILSHDIHPNPGHNFKQNFLNFMTWNVNSITKDNFQRARLIEAHNSLFNYDLISINETCINDSVVIPDVLIDNYTFVNANNSSNSRHGGVGLFYKNSLPVKVRNDISFDESIVVELKFGRKKLFYTVLYRSPAFKYSSPEFDQFLINFENLFQNIRSENPTAMFFMGDLNGHSLSWWPKGNDTLEGSKIDDLFTSLGLHQLIHEPTNFEPNKNPSCIDLIVTDQPNIVLDSGTRPSLDPLCHHQIIFCKINIRIPPPPPYERMIWHFNQANVKAIQKSITSFPWTQQLQLNSNPNWQVKIFTNTILNIMSAFVPNETKRIVPRDPPWISKPLKTLLKKKNRLFSAYKKHGYRAEDKERLDVFRSECKEAVETAKRNYITNLGNKMNDPSISSKHYWKIVNRVMNKSRQALIPPLLVANSFVINCSDKCDHFVKFFTEQCKPVINDSLLPPFCFFTNKRIENMHLVDNEIISSIRNLNPKKAMGPDGVSAHMLILCDTSLVLPLKLIYQNILDTSIFPDQWKLANVTPIHKKNDKQLVKNYRPISLLPICSKLFEKLIFNCLYRYLNNNGLITKNQSGFRPGDSTANQLLYLVNEIHEAFENPKTLDVRAIFLDISKAFDKVWHDGLIFKLRQNGISGNMLRLLESYLSNRKQRVVLNGHFSEYYPIEAGVPQGSVLGPLLFLVYINDLETNIKSNIKFFADDTMLFSIVNNPVNSANDLNDDLSNIHLWAHKWKMNFNPDRSKQATEVLFSCKKNKYNHPPLYFNGQIVKKMDEQKHLGLILDSSLSFAKHITAKISIARKNIGIIRNLSNYLPLKVLQQMYKVFVRSHLDYCDFIYHIPHNICISPLGISLTTLMESIEKVQYSGALALTGAWQGSSRSKLYEELGWESLSDRRMLRRVLQLYKISNRMTPNYLHEKLPPRKRTSLYSNDLALSYRLIRCRTLRYANSFFPDAINSWNNIINHFSVMPTIAVLKSHLISLVRPNPKRTFNIYDPIGLRFLFMLRLDLSPLRSHKFCNNFIDTLSDVCACTTATEDTEHFLLNCPLYADARALLLRTTNEIVLRNNLPNTNESYRFFLYGHHSLGESDNKQILLATINFIKSTKRFKE